MSPHQLQFIAVLFCSEAPEKLCGLSWGWVDQDGIFTFGWTLPLMHNVLSSKICNPLFEQRMSSFTAYNLQELVDFMTEELLVVLLHNHRTDIKNDIQMGKKVLKDWKSDWVGLGSLSETRRKEARGGGGGGGQLLMGLWEDAWRSIPLIVSGHLFSIRQISLSV